MSLVASIQSSISRRKAKACKRALTQCNFFHKISFAPRRKAKACKRALTHCRIEMIVQPLNGRKAKACKRALTHYLYIRVYIFMEKGKD